MRVSGILSAKGSDVATVSPTATVGEAIQELRRFGIGALVVSSDGRTIEGILSERDVVRCLAEQGGPVLEQPVAELMTRDVRTCRMQDSAEDLMREMTEHRTRHLPVEIDGVLSGLVSIGDVVKWRVTELEEEKRHLTDYIVTGR